VSAVANVAINLDSRGVPAKLKQIADRGKEVDRSLNGAAAATTKAGREIKTAANGMRYFTDAAGRARKVNGQFVTSTEAAAAGIKKQDTAARSLIGTMTKLAATAGAGRVAAGITRTAAGFEEELRRAAAIEGGGNLDQLRQSIERVASTAAGTPTEVAALATSLSRAGFTAKETSESLQGIVTGAEATSVAFDQLGSIVSSSLRSFGLATSDTASVVDTLVQTANSSNQTILDLGEALSYAAPGARTLGISIGDLSATIGLLADNGIRGSRAGTSLSTGLNRLQLAASGSQEELFEITRGSAMLTKAMDTLGSQVLDAEGNLKPLDDVLLALKGSLDQLNVGQRVELTKALFGEEAGRGFQALLASSEEKIRSMFQTIENSQGKTEQVREEMRGFSDSMKVLGGNIENTTNAIGDKFIVVLQPLVDGLNATLKAASELPKPIRDIGAAAAAAGIAVGGFALAFKTAAPLIELVAYKLGAGGLAGAMTALLNPIALGAAAFVGLSAVVIKYYADQAKLNKLLNASETMVGDLTGAKQELKNKIAETSVELQKAAGKLDQMRDKGVSNARAIQAQEKRVKELKKLLEGLEGEYTSVIKIIEVREKFGIDTLNAAPGTRGRQAAIDERRAEAKRKAAEKARLDALSDPSGGGAAARGAGAAAAKNDEAKRIQERISGLQQDVALNEKLRGIREKIAEADLAGDQALAVKLQGEERLLQLVDSYDRLKASAANNAERDALEAKLQSETLLSQQDVLAQLNKLDSDKAKAFEDQLRPLQEQRRLLEAQLNGRRQEEELMIQIENATRGLVPAEAQRVENLIRGNAALEEQLNQVDLLNEALAGAGEIIGNQLRGAIDGLIDGTADWNNILRDTLSQLGSFFLNLGLNQLAGPMGSPGILSFLGFGTKERANGGPVNANEPYIVGERGPELFIPFQQGNITSNEELKAQMREASSAPMAFAKPGADGKNGDDTISTSERRLLERSYADRLRETREVMLPFTRSAEQASIVAAERETAQAISNPGPIDVRYESTVVNGVEYVTAEQHQAGMAQAAERGRALTLAALQNSVKARSRVGI